MSLFLIGWTTPFRVPASIVPIAIAFPFYNTSRPFPCFARGGHETNLAYFPCAARPWWLAGGVAESGGFFDAIFV